MTERIYENDSYCREFNATVLSCDYKDGFYYVELDKTAFFPEGGGQAADKGAIAHQTVLDVQIANGIILHKLNSKLEVGQIVNCKLDWDLRFERMQSHAGEHIVSGIINSMFGYSNVGFHMSEKSMTLDVDGPLTQQDILQIELNANKVIYSNCPITVLNPSKEELESINYRSKIEIDGQVRLVKIGDVDICACCAPHPSKTGDIGIIKIIDFFNYKKGTRIEMVAGINAYLDYCAINNSNKEIMKMLSAARNSTHGAVAKLNDTLSSLREEKQRIAKELALYKLVPVMVNGSAYAFSQDLTYDDLRYCANHHIKNGSKNCAFFSTVDENLIYVISGEPEKVKSLVSKVNAAFNGKGGGKDGYAQGKISSSRVDDVIELIENQYSLY